LAGYRDFTASAVGDLSPPGTSRLSPANSESPGVLPGSYNTVENVLRRAEDIRGKSV
jgi:hypothetical protein